MSDYEASSARPRNHQGGWRKPRAIVQKRVRLGVKLEPTCQRRIRDIEQQRPRNDDAVMQLKLEHAVGRSQSSKPRRQADEQVCHSRLTAEDPVRALQQFGKLGSS